MLVQGSQRTKTKASGPQTTNGTSHASPIRLHNHDNSNNNNNNNKKMW